jgi:hypothetical protein
MRRQGMCATACCDETINKEWGYKSGACWKGGCGYESAKGEGEKRDVTVETYFIFFLSLFGVHLSRS